MRIAKAFQYGPIHACKLGYWPFGRPKMFVHLFFVDGLLIDTGQSNMRKEVLQQIAQWSVQQVYITHHHEDHSGNLAAVQEHCSCPTYASSLCVEMMKDPPGISPAQWLTWGPSAANFSLIAQDQQVQTAQYRFDIIPVPGHAEDMVCLHEAQQGWLFSADLFVSEYIRFFMRRERMRRQIASIKKVLALDFELLLCNHNPQLSRGKEQLKNKLQFLEDFYGTVQKYHEQGLPLMAIYKKMKLKPDGFLRYLSLGELSTRNMIRSVIRDEKEPKS
ncbi:MAG: MBL fold metallo-hydrolase [Bacteroidota bacterium]